MILDRVAHPIVQAPMAGGPSTPALAVAVAEAGGLGFVAAGYRSVDALRDDVRAVRAATDRPFGVNVFVPSSAAVDDAALRAYVSQLRDEAARYGVEPGEPRFDDDGWAAKLEVVRQEGVELVSFTFGCPRAEVLRSLDGETWVTVTSVAEARAAAAAGADALVVQGVEAGGHRASFLEGGEALAVLPLLRLVAAEVDLPLVATGGIADGASVAAALAAGAVAAQLGTAFMLAPEAATNPAHRAALATDAPTALTRAFSGRDARGIRNRFMRDHPDAPRAYPQIHYATSPIRAAAREREDGDGFNLWAGEAHRLTLELPAGEIVRRLADEARAAAQAAAARLTPSSSRR